MLKTIPPGITPDLLFALAKMGHGDVLAVVDSNFPAYSQGPDVIRMDGVDLPGALELILTLLPLDTFEPPVARMAVVDDPDAVPAAAADAIDVIRDAEQRDVPVRAIERFAFYQATRGAFAIVATAESRPYGCFLLTKGVLGFSGPEGRD